jgi:hypothetical protein
MVYQGPPGKMPLDHGQVIVQYPAGQIGVQVIALAGGSVHMIAIPPALTATTYCKP